jgi:hypothetical protein
MHATVSTEGDRVVLSISRSDSPEVQRMLLTRDQAWWIARQLIRGARDVQS